MISVHTGKNVFLCNPKVDMSDRFLCDDRSSQTLPVYSKLCKGAVVHMLALLFVNANALLDKWPNRYSIPCFLY